MKFQAFIGPTYLLKSKSVDAQRCVNLYPELIESGTGKGGDMYALFGTPGLEDLFTVGTGPIRLIHIDRPPKSVFNPANRIFICSGNKMFKCSYDGTTWTTTEIGTLTTSTGPVTAVSLNVPAGSNLQLGAVMFVDGTNNYYYRKFSTDGLTTETFQKLTDYGPDYFEVPGATHVTMIDSYLIFNEKDTNRFYVSDLNTFTVDPLSFASAEGDPDNVMSLVKNGRDLWLLNERTAEIFGNTGNPDAPFQRVSGGYFEKGIAARYSVGRMEGLLAWVGRDEIGQGVVYAAQGAAPQRISTHAVEQAIAGYADISTATAYTYQSEGHAFYVLNFTEATWVYDLSTKLWHERAYLNADGDLERHRADCCAYFPEYNLHLVGDYENGKVYALNNNYFKDGTQPIKRLRVTPHVSNGLRELICRSLQIDMQVGVGLDGVGEGTDPQLVLSYSDDGGNTWTSEATASAGKTIGGIGEYTKRVLWRRLGKFRSRIFSVSTTDPVRVVLIGAEIDLEQGTK